MKLIKSRNFKIFTIGFYASVLLLTGIGWLLLAVLQLDPLFAIVPTILLVVLTVLGFLAFVWTMFGVMVREVIGQGKNPDWMDLFGTLLVGIFALVSSIVMVGIAFSVMFGFILGLA